MSIQTRQPSGTPVGGQFATTARTESATTLVGPGYDPAAELTENRPSARSPEHGELAARGVGEGKLSMLAPVEAKSLVAGVHERGVADDRPRVRQYVDAYLRWRDLAETGSLYETRARRIVDEATRQFGAARLGFADAQDAVKRGDPGAGVRSEEAQDDLSAAVRRFDDARADLRYLTDPQWRRSPAGTVTTNDFLAWEGAKRRFADKGYRGMVN